MRKSKAFKKKIMRIVSAIFIFFSVPSYADFSDNLRVSLDGSARLNNNIAENNTSRIYSLGLDTHKVFSSANGDIGYAVGQLYLTKRGYRRGIRHTKMGGIQRIMGYNQANVM